MFDARRSCLRAEARRPLCGVVRGGRSGLRGGIVACVCGGVAEGVIGRVDQLGPGFRLPVQGGGVRSSRLRKTRRSPFESLRANGDSAENQGIAPFVVSLSNHKSGFSEACSRLT